MATVNEKLLDALIAHQVDLNSYSNGVVRKIIAILNRVDQDLFVQLTLALDELPADSFTVQRLEQLLHSVRALNAKAYRAAGAELTDEMLALADYEASYQLELFRGALPVQLALNTVNLQAVHAAVVSRPFQGRLLREWASSIEADRMTRIRDTVRIGFVEGLPTPEIVRRVRGTRARGYEDGVIEIDRRHAEAVVRTAVSHTAGTAKEHFYDANQDLIKALSWTSTLDSRTSEICRIRDGKQYHPKTHAPIGHKLPWLGGPGKAHWQCRSCSVPVVKSWKELGGAADVAEFSASTRASMDGQVPADQTYGEWLKKQSAARQDQILGRTRGEMFRKGNLPIEKFYNDKGRWLTLEELRKQSGLPAATPRPTPSPTPSPPPGPTQPPRPQFDASTESGRWHVKAFEAAPAWVRDVVAHEKPVQVDYLGGGAFAQRGVRINMGDEKVQRGGQSVAAMEAPDRQATWRHEFGHILDARMAGGMYRSSEGEFQPAQHQDAVLLISAAARGRASKALETAQQQRTAEYAQARDLVTAATGQAERERVLNGLANRAGVDYKEFVKLVSESTLIEDHGVGAHVRLATMLTAVRRGDAEEFIRQAMFMTRDDLAQGVEQTRRSWLKDGSFGALADLVGSATRNKVADHNQGFWGHSDGYYSQTPWNAATESFANLTALAGHGNGYWWELVKRFTPNMAREFEAIFRKAIASNG